MPFSFYSPQYVSAGSFWSRFRRDEKKNTVNYYSVMFFIPLLNIISAIDITINYYENIFMYAYVMKCKYLKVLPLIKKILRYHSDEEYLIHAKKLN